MYRQNMKLLFESSGGNVFIDDKKHNANCASLQLPLENLAATLAGRNKEHPFILLPSEVQLKELRRVSEYVRRRFKRMVVVGLGAASSCGMALAAFGNHRGIDVDVIDNVDRDSITKRLQQWNHDETAYVLVSRSGETQETLELAKFLYQHHKNLAGSDDKPFFGLCGERNSSLAGFCRDIGVRVIFFDSAVSGRFSIVHEAGLLPAMVAGCDGAALLAGASSLLQSIGKGVAPHRFAPAMAAAAMATHIQNGRAIHVLLSYGDVCERLTRWLMQLYGESLGKNGTGMTPIACRGTSDEHSQLQLWCDGPQDKVFTILARAYRITDEGDELDVMLDAHWRAVRDELTAQNNPLRLLTWSHMDDETLGALVMHCMLEVYFLACLLGVNAFDEPAVRSVKQRVMQFYDDAKAEAS